MTPARGWRRMPPPVSGTDAAARLGVEAEVVATVPYLADDIHDLAGLLRIGSHLW